MVSYFSPPAFFLLQLLQLLNPSKAVNRRSAVSVLTQIVGVYWVFCTLKNITPSAGLAETFPSLTAIELRIHKVRT